MDLGSDWYGKEVRFSEEPPSHQSSTQHLLPHRVCGLGNKVLGSHQVTVSLFITNFDQFCRGNEQMEERTCSLFDAKMCSKDKQLTAPTLHQFLKPGQMFSQVPALP